MIRYLLLCIALLSVLAGCSKKPHEGVAVIVNGYEITRPEIIQAAEILRESMIAAFPGKAVEGVTDELMAGAARQLITNRLLSEEAADRGIVAEKNTVDSTYDLLRKQLPDKAAFERELIKMGETDSSFREKVKEGICLEQLMTKVLANARQIDSQECRAFYNNNKEVYKNTPRIRISQIFFPLKDSITGTAKSQLIEKASDVRRQILAGKSFAECALKYSSGPGSTEGGDIGWFKKGDLRPELDTPLIALKKGEITPVITTDVGLHILLKADEESETIQPYEEVEKRIRFLLEMKERNTLVSKHVDSLMLRAKIKYIDTTLAKKPFTAEPGSLPAFGN